MKFYLPYWFVKEGEKSCWRYLEVSGKVLPQGEVPEGAPTISSRSAAVVPTAYMQGVKYAKMPTEGDS